MISSSISRKKMISSSEYSKVQRCSCTKISKSQQKLSITKETTHKKLSITEKTTHKKLSITKKTTHQKNKKTVGSKQEVVSRKTGTVKDRCISSAKKGFVALREEKHKSHDHNLDVHNHYHHYGRVDVHHHIYHQPCEVVIKYESEEEYYPGISGPIHWWK